MFNRGDDVICIDAKGAIRGNEAIPVEGRHYTIREGSFDVAGRPCCFLVEIVNPVRDYVILGTHYRIENPWEERRFAFSNRYSIAIFREMCTAISSVRTLVRVGE